MHDKKYRADQLKQLNEVINAQANEVPNAEENSGIWMMRKMHHLLESLNNSL